MSDQSKNKTRSPGFAVKRSSFLVGKGQIPGEPTAVEKDPHFKSGDLLKKAATADNAVLRRRRHYSFLAGSKRVRLAATVDRVTQSGLCFVVDDYQRMYGFMLDRVKNYAGQSPEEIGLHRGDRVELSIVNGKVLSVATAALRQDVHSRP